MDIICTRCSNALFNEVWGDYKCAIRKQNIYNFPTMPADCSDFSEGKPQTSKETYLYVRSEGNEQ